MERYMFYWGNDKEECFYMDIKATEKEVKEFVDKVHEIVEFREGSEYEGMSDQEILKSILNENCIIYKEIDLESIAIRF